MNYPKKAKHNVVWWAHEQNAKGAKAYMGEDHAEIYALGDMPNIAYCLLKKTEKGLCFYCDDERWHYEDQINRPPKIDKKYPQNTRQPI